MTPYGREVLRKVCEHVFFEEVPAWIDTKACACHICGGARQRARLFVNADVLVKKIRNPRAKRQMVNRVVSNLYCDICLVRNFGNDVVPNFDVERIEL